MVKIQGNESVLFFVGFFREEGKKAEVKEVKHEKKEIKCPYCGSKAKLVHFYDIYGKDATHPERYAWACARFPQCDSYVSTIKGSTKPAGTLADAQLRHERIEAHRVIKKVVESGMDQHSVYRYLEDRMGLQRDQLHIASSGIYYCRLVQQILKSLLACK